MNSEQNQKIFKDFYVKELSEEEFYKLSGAKEDVEYFKQKETIAPKEDLKTFEQMTKIITKIHSNAIKNSKPYGIYEKDVYVGFICFDCTLPKSPELEINIKEEYRGQGVGYNVSNFLIEKEFKNQEVEFILYRAKVDNEASIKLVKKLGGKEVFSGEIIEKIIKTYHIYRKD